MKRRTYAHFGNGAFATGWVKTHQRTTPSAWSGEFLASRATRPIEAAGGPCPIIAIYDPNSVIGALIHVDGGDAEIDGDSHEVLIDALLANIPDVSTDAIVHLFFDPVPYPGMLSRTERKEQRAARIAFGKRIVEYLEERGFSGVKTITNGLGKTVVLDTINGRLIAHSDNDQILDLEYPV